MIPGLLLVIAHILWASTGSHCKSHNISKQCFKEQLRQDTTYNTRLFYLTQ